MEPAPERNLPYFKRLQSMDPEKLKSITRSGGKKLHAIKKAHKFTSEEAKKAGSKGGKTNSKRTQKRIWNTYLKKQQTESSKQ